jgi:hypothetical protein
VVGEGPVDEIVYRTHESDVVVDRVVVVRGPEQLAVNSVDATRVSIHTVENVCAIAELLQSGVHHVCPSQVSTATTSSTGRRIAGRKVRSARSLATGSRQPGRRHESSTRGVPAHQLGDELAADPRQIRVAVQPGDLIPKFWVGDHQPAAALLIDPLAACIPMRMHSWITSTSTGAFRSSALRAERVVIRSWSTSMGAPCVTRRADDNLEQIFGQSSDHSRTRSPAMRFAWSRRGEVT